MELASIESCRVCGNTYLEDVFDIGDQYLQGSFEIAGSPSPSNERIPMQLVRCDPGQKNGACGLLQLRHSVPPEVLYANYWYTSGTTQTMTRHLAGIVSTALKYAPAESSRVLDIGCNDGTLLDNYPESFERWGIDPSDIALAVGDSVNLVQDTFPSQQLRERLANAKFDVVTSIAMYYDLSDPVGFAAEIEGLLTDEGIWIVEMSYMPMMLYMNSLDTVCHEHLEYYSLGVLEHIAAAAGMRIIEASLNDINGGSIQLVLCKQDSRSHADTCRNLELLREFESGLQLHTSAAINAFRERVEAQRTEMIALVRGIQDRGETIHVYGASTKGNVLIQWYGFDRSELPYAADKNPKKVGAKTVGTAIEIISEEDSRAMQPDYYLVLPWHFRREFLEREKDTIFAGAKMIFPLPELLVVSSDNFDEALADSANYLEAFKAKVGIT